MSSAPRERRRRDLFVARALGTLSGADARELERLLGGAIDDERTTSPGAPAPPDDYELAAAALHLAFAVSDDSPPEGFRHRLRERVLARLDPELNS